MDLEKKEGMYYQKREIKGADQLRGHLEADLRLCFGVFDRIQHKTGCAAKKDTDSLLYTFPIKVGTGKTGARRALALLNSQLRVQKTEQSDDTPRLSLELLIIFQKRKR